MSNHFLLNIKYWFNLIGLQKIFIWWPNPFKVLNASLHLWSSNFVKLFTCDISYCMFLLITSERRNYCSTNFKYWDFKYFIKARSGSLNPLSWYADHWPNRDVSKVIYRVNMQDRVNRPTKTLQGLQKVNFNAILTYRRLCIPPSPPHPKIYSMQYILWPDFIMSLPFISRTFYIQELFYFVLRLCIGGPFNKS